MIYLVCFIFCLWADNKDTNWNKILILFVYVTFCFGYTTGTDWSFYELYYLDSVSHAHFEEREKGFVTLVNLFRPLIPDFWLFNALCKIFYIWALTSMLGCFTHKKWTAFAFTMIFSTMFMVINCPMRFMIGAGLLFLAVKLYIQHHKICAVAVSLISMTFHTTMIIPIILCISGVFASKFYNLSRLTLFITTIISGALATLPVIYNFIFTQLLEFIGLGIFINSSYSYFDPSGLLSIGSIRNLIICCIIIYYKNIFDSRPYGKLIFFYAIISFWLGYICNPIHTSYRLIIFNSQMVCVALTTIIFCPKKNYGTLIKYIKPSIYIVLIILLIKQSYESYVYYPYTNSIPYILFGHKTYNERINYNKIVYSRDIGSIVEGSSEVRGERID